MVKFDPKKRHYDDTPKKNVGFGISDPKLKKYDKA